MHNRTAKFVARYHRPPTDQEFYLLWNAPSVLLATRHPSLSTVLLARASRFANLCSVK